MGRLLLPIVASLIALMGTLSATLFLYRGARGAFDVVMDTRLRASGETAAYALGELPIFPERVLALMRTNGLDGALVIDSNLSVVADASGAHGVPVDLLRINPARIEEALQGRASVERGYSVGHLEVATGYFPIQLKGGPDRAVLVLEAGKTFYQAQQSLLRALAAGLGFGVLGSLALFVIATRWWQTERERSEAAVQSARANVLSRMAAMAAHDIRNPLTVIRGTVDLMRLRMHPLSERQDQDTRSILEEVTRLQRLTEDLLDLSADRPLSDERINLSELLQTAAVALEASHPEIKVRREISPDLFVRGDAGRLRQIFANLLTNAAQAQRAGQVALRAWVEKGHVVSQVHDDGPGVSQEVRAHLFDPFVTTRSGGTGLGLSIADKMVRRHGGKIALLEVPTGTTFEVRLPAS